MSCNCNTNGNTYNIGMGCCRPSIMPADDFYTKPQIDAMLEEIESGVTSGCCITPEEVDEKIESAKTEIESEIPSLSGYATEQWVEDKHYITGVDLSDYALKSEIPTVPTDVSAFNNDAGYITSDALSGKQDTLIAGDNITISGNVISAVGGSGSTGCNCDLSDYVTFEDMGEYVGDVYTKTEVNNLFVTKTTFNTYITNLQQQIDSLKEAISGCCSQTGETEYRWIVVPNDYTCSGTTKMAKEKQQSSTDGINWTDTGQYRTGSTVLEYDSADCGYIPSSNFKAKATYKKGKYSPIEVGQVECNSSTTLTNDEIKAQITFPTYFLTLEIGSCIDTIGEDAFINGGNVSQVIIPSNVKTLDTCAFSNCGFASYQISEGLTTIGNTAFVNNYSLSAITLPSTVTSIGIQAFFNCSNLTTVTVLATTPPTVSYTQGWNTGIFDGCGNLTTIYVPAASVNAYKAADGWILYADKIQAIP